MAKSVSLFQESKPDSNDLNRYRFQETQRTARKMLLLRLQGKTQIELKKLSDEFVKLREANFDTNIGPSECSVMFKEYSKLLGQQTAAVLFTEVYDELQPQEVESASAFSNSLASGS